MVNATGADPRANKGAHKGAYVQLSEIRIKSNDHYLGGVKVYNRYAQ